MLLDPTQFSITQSKEMGMWPPGDITGIGIWPYVKRLKEQNLRVLDVGVMKGENAVFLLEKDTDNKIKKVYGVVSYDQQRKQEFENYESILKKNTDGLARFSLNYSGQSCHVVCVHSNSELDVNLEKYYTAVKSNGIFCGNEHDQSRVKDALTNFRRKNKIGTPIMISNGCWFWIKR